MNKLEILAKLLKEDKITVEEFKTLLEPYYINQYQPYWYQNYPYTTGYTTTTGLEKREPKDWRELTQTNHMQEIVLGNNGTI